MINLALMHEGVVSLSTVKAAIRQSTRFKYFALTHKRSVWPPLGRDGNVYGHLGWRVLK